jgi:hypothetical protein
VLAARYSAGAGVLLSRAAFAGFEHIVWPWLYLRAGLAYDARGYGGQSLGIGIAPSRNSSIDIGWQRGTFPELQPEFGRARVLTASFSIAW